MKVTWKEAKEEARLYAEMKMGDNWDRNDPINIGNFYDHYIFFLQVNFKLSI